jgi:integrase/recombinase XerD
MPLGQNSLSTMARYKQFATTKIAIPESAFDRLSLDIVPPG